MKRKIIISVSFTVLLVPFMVNAALVTPTQASNQENEAYLTCKKTALSRKEQTMLPFLKEYRDVTEVVTNQEKNELAKVQWFSNSSYQNEINIIETKKYQTMLLINQKMSKIRSDVKERWKAEDALCDYLHRKALSEISPKDKK